MGNLKPKELSKIGYIQDTTRSLVVGIVQKHFKHHGKEAILELLQAIKAKPLEYIQDEVLQKIARTFITEEQETNSASYDLLVKSGQLKVYGGKNIESSVRQQMEVAMSLPISVQGALMPDAHTGYELPIGAVLAAKNSVIPYAVGVDIGCRMALSIIDANAGYLKANSYQLKQLLKDYTHFGTEGHLDFKQEHAILDDIRFKETALLQKLHGKAVKQLGSSGSGNHFVEFGLLQLQDNNAMALPEGTYLALLSHSGSRGLGANIAMHYTGIAMEYCKLPREAKSLAWLDMDSAAGQEYWLSMNLAGDYAKACHDAIHYNLLKALGLKAITKIENHHNFAWKQILENGEEVIVHRKGATPAAKRELGIIPGSMTTPAYVVSGKGNPQSLASAAHGAGRAMSRKRAKELMTVSNMKKSLANAGVTLIGGSVEENSTAYKDIETVMQAQKEVVHIEGIFHPKIVRMNKE